jgi:hypothetical protein
MNQITSVQISCQFHCNFFFFFFEIVSPYVPHIGLKFMILLPQLPSAGITDILHHTQLKQSLFLIFLGLFIQENA